MSPIVAFIGGFAVGFCIPIFAMVLYAVYQVVREEPSQRRGSRQ